MRNARLVLVTPTFHGYHASIADGFRQLGYDITSYCYDLYDTPAAKLRNKLRLELPERIGIHTHAARSAWDTARAIAALRELNPDRVIVIKGDSLGEDFWDYLTDAGIPATLWLYDDLQRHRYLPERLRALHSVVTYASSEARRLAELGVSAHVVPNAFDPNLAVPAAARRRELVFVGARYPNRSELLERLVDDALPVRAYGRQWSRHPYDRLRTFELRRPRVEGERDIPLAKAYRVQGCAAGAINIHGLQAGLSMRTFEIPGMGGVQLVDRPDVAEFYEPGAEVLIYDTYDELKELATWVLTDARAADKIRRSARERSLAHHTFRHRAADIVRLWS